MNREILNMRIEGWSFKEIAAALKVSTQAVWARYEKAISLNGIEDKQTIAEARKLEIARNEAAWLVWYPRFLQGDEKAGKECRWLADQRIKLLNLSEPVKLDITMEHTARLEISFEDELSELVESMRTAGAVIDVDSSELPVLHQLPTISIPKEDN